MSLVTYNPFSLLGDLQRDMNRLFDHRLTQNGSSVARADWAPTVDVHEDDSGYHFAVDLPGVRREDLEVTAHNGVLSIRGERKAVHEDKKLQRCERIQGTFLREFSMPENADLDAIQAKCQDGVLAIFVPKAATAQPKRIEIQ